MKLRFTKRAIRQIEEIIEAIAQESPQGARRVGERMQSITTLLIEHPHIGQQTDVAGIRRDAQFTSPCRGESNSLWH